LCPPKMVVRAFLAVSWENSEPNQGRHSIAWVKS
jgi:hypothetical protein